MIPVGAGPERNSKNATGSNCRDIIRYMNIKECSSPEKLEEYSFKWSQIRLLVAAVALFIGGIPPVLYFFPGSALLSLFLKLAWIMSGFASGYMLYRWNLGKRMVFGGSQQKDVIAFFVSVVSGLNLGVTGLLGLNIGMSVFSNKLIFILVGLLYLAAAYHLQIRWKANGKKMFPAPAPTK